MSMTKEEMMERLGAALKGGDTEVITWLQKLQSTSLGNDAVKDIRSKETSRKILIIGDIKMSVMQAVGFAKSVGISRERLDFQTGYDRFKHASIGKYQYNDEYALILIGAIPHSVKDTGYYSSLISLMENEPGFPRVIRMGRNGLKVTLSNFKQAIRENLRSGYIVAA